MVEIEQICESEQFAHGLTQWSFENLRALFPKSLVLPKKEVA